MTIKRLFTLMPVIVVLLAVAPAAANCLTSSKHALQKRAAPYAKSIAKHAKRYAVDSNLIRAVIAVESCFNPDAVSSKGAVGLMQLIPETAERFGVSDSFSADQNIRGGTRYLSVLIKRYHGDLRRALAAYNAGEGKVDLHNGIPPYHDTLHYVQDVLLTWQKLSPSTIAASVKYGYRVAKPGREGIESLKRRAPHLFKQD